MQDKYETKIGSVIWFDYNGEFVEGMVVQLFTVAKPTLDASVSMDQTCYVIPLEKLAGFTGRSDVVPGSVKAFTWHHKDAKLVIPLDVHHSAVEWLGQIAPMDSLQIKASQCEHGEGLKYTISRKHEIERYEGEKREYKGSADLEPRLKQIEYEGSTPYAVTDAAYYGQEPGALIWYNDAAGSTGAYHVAE